MPITMRPTGLASPVDRGRQDYTIYSGAWAMGRIYEERAAPAPLCWSWSIFGAVAKPCDMRTNGRTSTLDAAKAEFEASWRKWLEWAKLSELV